MENVQTLHINIQKMFYLAGNLPGTLERSRKVCKQSAWFSFAITINDVPFNNL